MDHHVTRRTFLKHAAITGMTLPLVMQGTSSRARAASPNGLLNHVSFGGGGMAAGDAKSAGRNPRCRLHAIVDVDEERSRALREEFPDALYFRDWRELFEKEGDNFESCNVSVPDHMHAPIALTALRMGKHVYCQKPLCQNLHETRVLTEAAAARPELVTQMGIQVHSRPAYLQGVELIRSGAIGKIHTAYGWSHKNWGRNDAPPEHSDPVPDYLDWDLWLGTAPERPYVDKIYHPSQWRRWQDFGTGTFGDMGCHMYDPIVKAMDLKAPTQVMSIGPAPVHDGWAEECEVVYHFPATDYTVSRGVTVTWCDGARKPPAHMMTDLGDFPLPKQGTAFVGTEGTMVLQHVSAPRLFPREKYQGFKYPEVEDDNHWRQFINACLGEGTTRTPFSYSGPLTETVLLGTVATRFPNQLLEWDSANLRFTNFDDANAFIGGGKYREGWEVEGLG